jgi:vacuolar-type H+-ATPase subunit I/STV1
LREQELVKFLGKNGLLSKLKKRMGRMSKGPDDTGVAAGSTLSLMTQDMITPVDKPISINRAVQVYKKYMLRIGYLEKSDLSDFVRSLKEEMAAREEELKYEITNAKELIKEAKAEVKSLTKQLSRCKDDDDREYVQEELDTVVDELNQETVGCEKLIDELAMFKKDKRMFLLNFINSEIHGDEWQELRAGEKKYDDFSG